jgi:superfamily I DNA/RNA helicase
MIRFITEEQWEPVGVLDLEPKAEEVVRSVGHRLVVAGPGSGKTELLAQRADFLLRTGRCASPRRILAISFKRDAAKNLEARVRARTTEDAERFDSLTLDAFAKRLVDRFLPALPAGWRPSPAYQVRTEPIRVEETELWLSGAPVPDGHEQPEVRAWDRPKVRRVFDLVMHGAQLPYDQESIHPLIRVWGLHWWREQIRCAPGQPSLTFPMLNRLAAFLLRCNPKVRAALCGTYSAVFLDEFQDTTASQWDLVRAAFLGSAVVLTAVGDNKQRIMAWAGAKVDVFEDYQAEFGAECVELVRNYRSVPDLVRMKHVIAQAVEAGAAEPVSASDHAEGGVCTVLEFANPEEEATYLADLICRELEDGSAVPRDFCILVRQRAAAMVEILKSELRDRGVTLRDESALQDLLAEPLTEVIVNALRLGTSQRDAVAWGALLGMLVRLSGLDEVRDGVQLEKLAEEHMACVREVIGDRKIGDLPHRIVGILGDDRYRSTFRQYVSGDYFDRIVDSLGMALAACLGAGGDSTLVADELLGVDVVPAMTIHKSKGLEFQTVIFLGLEDGQWWAFRSQAEEEKRAFFVAFSRAVRRVIFTFSDQRDTAWGRRRQAKSEVDALHSILQQAGVQTINMRGYRQA